jgi:hypothetical protein
LIAETSCAAADLAFSGVPNWVGRVISNALSGVGSVAVATATEIIPKLFEKYYGL